jgi:hypothetical protein
MPLQSSKGISRIDYLNRWINQDTPFRFSRLYGPQDEHSTANTSAPNASPEERPRGLQISSSMFASNDDTNPQTLQTLRNSSQSSTIRLSL